MSANRTKLRQHLDSAERALGELSALEALFDAVTSSRPAKERASNLGGVIELTEVSPGVYAAPSRTRTPGEVNAIGRGIARGYRLVRRVRDALHEADELQRRSRELAKGGTWPKRK